MFTILTHFKNVVVTVDSKIYKCITYFRDAQASSLLVYVEKNSRNPRFHAAWVLSDYCTSFLLLKIDRLRDSQVQKEVSSDQNRKQASLVM